MDREQADIVNNVPNATTREAMKEARGADQPEAVPDLNTPFDAPIRAQKARDDAAFAEGLRRQAEYMKSPEFRALVTKATPDQQTAVDDVQYCECATPVPREPAGSSLEWCNSCGFDIRPDPKSAADNPSSV
jgi:hypothetical protein